MARLSRKELYSMLAADAANFKKMYYDLTYTLVDIAKHYYNGAHPDYIRDYAKGLGYQSKSAQLTNSRKALKKEILANLEKLHIDEMWTKEQLVQYYNITHDFLQILLKEANIHKSPKLVAATAKKTIIDTYGVDNAYKCDQSVKSKESRSKKNKINKNDLRNLYNKHGTAWVAEYFNISQTYVDKLRAQYNIPNRPMRKSIEETLLYEHIIQNTSEIVKQSDRTILGGKEIDILINNKHIGFEYNGIFWHNSEICNEYFHIRKSGIAMNNQVTLYHIFSDAFNHKKQTVFDFILDKINPTILQVPTAQTVCKEISFNKFSEFYKANSISLMTNNSNQAYGMYVGDELVRVCRYADNIITDFVSKLFVNYDPSLLINFIIDAKSPMNLYIKIDISENPDFSLEGFEHSYTQLPNKLFFKNNGSNILKHTAADGDLFIWNAGYKMMKYTN